MNEIGDEGKLIGYVLNFAVRDVTKLARRIDDLSVLQNALKVAVLGGYKTKARVLLAQIGRVRKAKVVRV